MSVHREMLRHAARHGSIDGPTAKFRGWLGALDRAIGDGLMRRTLDGDAAVLTRRGWVEALTQPMRLALKAAVDGDVPVINHHAGLARAIQAATARGMADLGLLTVHKTGGVPRAELTDRGRRVLLALLDKEAAWHPSLGKIVRDGLDEWAGALDVERQKAAGSGEGRR